MRKASVDNLNQRGSTTKISLISPSKYFQSGVRTFTLRIKDIFEEICDLEHISFYMQMPLFLYPGRKRVKADLKKTGKKRENHQIIDWYNIFTWKKALKKITSNSNVMYVPWWTIGVSLPILFLLGKSRKRQIKTIVEFHNVYDHDSNFLIKLVTKILVKRVVNKADKIIIHSKKDKEKLCSINPKAEKAVLIPLVSFDFLLTKSFDRIEERKNLGIGENKNVLLMFGLVRKYKGLEYAIEATQILKERGQNVFLLVVGECWMNKEEILELIQENSIQEDILWIDAFIQEEEIAKYFTVADIAIYPYTSASQSGSMQIAFASSIPVVATDVGGFSDIIINGENGILCNKKDSEDLARSIDRLIQSDEFKNKIIDNAKKQILVKTNKDYIKDVYYKIIEVI